MAKKRVTPEEHQQHYDELLDYINEEINKRAKKKQEGVNVLRKTKKLVLKLKREQPKVRKARPPNSNNSFNKEVLLSDELCEFLQLPNGSRLPRIEVINAINVYCKLTEDESRPHMLKWKHINTNQRNLQNPEKRNVIIPDERLSELLKYEQYKKDVENGLVTMKHKGIQCTVNDDHLWYYVMVKLIQPHLIKIEEK